MAVPFDDADLVRMQQFTSVVFPDRLPESYNHESSFLEAALIIRQKQDGWEDRLDKLQYRVRVTNVEGQVRRKASHDLATAQLWAEHRTRAQLPWLSRGYASDSDSDSDSDDSVDLEAISEAMHTDEQIATRFMQQTPISADAQRLIDFCKQNRFNFGSSSSAATAAAQSASFPPRVVQPPRLVYDPTTGNSTAAAASVATSAASSTSQAAASSSSSSVAAAPAAPVVLAPFAVDPFEFADEGADEQPPLSSLEPMVDHTETSSADISSVADSERRSKKKKEKHASSKKEKKKSSKKKKVRGINVETEEATESDIKDEEEAVSSPQSRRRSRSPGGASRKKKKKKSKVKAENHEPPLIKWSDEEDYFLYIVRDRFGDKPLEFKYAAHIFTTYGKIKRSNEACRTEWSSLTKAKPTMTKEEVKAALDKRMRELVQKWNNQPEHLVTHPILVQLFELVRQRKETAGK